MKYRFLLHSLSHAIVAVDIAQFGLSTEACPPEGRSQLVTALRFPAWIFAGAHFSALGANPASLEETETRLKKFGVCVLTI